MKNYKHLIPVLLVLTLGLLTACGQAEPEPEPTAPPAELTESSGNSILSFNNDEGSAELIRCFEDGNIPEEANILYDQMGANPDITIRDPETIRDLYDLLRMVEVTGETNESITDCYHHIQFKLAEDHYVYYSFEGSDIWCYGTKHYAIRNSGKLFTFMRGLTEEYCESMAEEEEAPEMTMESETESGLQEEIFDTILLQYRADWTAADCDGIIVMSRDGTDNPPFFSVEELGYVNSPETFLNNQMDAFREKYGNRMAKPPEATSMEIAGMELTGFVAAYSIEDGSGTITRYEYVEVIDDSCYHFVCEYVSSASGDRHEDETTYFEFMQALENMKIKAE